MSSKYVKPPRRFGPTLLRIGVFDRRSAREPHLPRGCRKLNEAGERCSLQAGHRGECE